MRVILIYNYVLNNLYIGKIVKALSKFKKLECGVINKIDESILGGGTDCVSGEIEARLLEMGFIEGATVQVLQKGMWGGEPIAVRINNNNTLISLRKKEASVIMTQEV